MKNFYTLLLFLFSAVSIFAQAPEKMSYQAVLRDASNVLITNQEVGMQISILQTTITGSAVYTETQTATTNINGLVSLEIGSGTSLDDFSAIDWSAGPYFIKTATDPAGGTSYSITGTSQLMSVPFAMYAKTSGSATPGPQGEPGANGTNGTNGAQGIQGATGADGANGEKGATGDQGAAGLTTSVNAIVQIDGNITITTTNIPEGDHMYYTEALVSANTDVAANTAKDGMTKAQATAITANTAKVGYTEALVSANTDVAANTAKVGVTTHAIGDSFGGGIVFFVYDGGQHGLIAATADQSTRMRWYGGSYTNIRARADGIGAGLKNTAIIIANQGPVDGNAFAATVCNEYSVTVDGVTYGDWYLPSKHELNLLYIERAAVGGFTTNYYWSSTEYGTLDAWLQIFNGGYQFYDNKSSTDGVRAVRAF
jgi:hypothetical protein